MNDFTKGGRGKKAPYKTVHYPIPTPIKPTLEMLADQYHQLVAAGLDSEADEMLERVRGAIAEPSCTLR